MQPLWDTARKGHGLRHTHLHPHQRLYNTSSVVHCCVGAGKVVASVRCVVCRTCNISLYNLAAMVTAPLSAKRFKCCHALSRVGFGGIPAARHTQAFPEQGGTQTCTRRHTPSDKEITTTQRTTQAVAHPQCDALHTAHCTHGYCTLHSDRCSRSAAMAHTARENR